MTTEQIEQIEHIEAIEQTEQSPRTYALHLVDADLDHLERAIREPENRMLTVEYWQRRVLTMRRQFELTREQRARSEALLDRLAQRENGCSRAELRAGQSRSTLDA